VAAKTEEKEAKEQAPDETAQESRVATQGAPGAAASWIPAVVAVLLAPVASVAVAQFVLIPRLQKKLAVPPAAAAAAEAAAPAEAASGAKPGADGKPGAPTNSYDFTNVVVNLNGTMGTRYLKTSFTITGTDKDLKQLFDGNKARLTDVTLNVLSALSLADLEEPGAKNVLRGKLVSAYNQALGHRAVDQVYFSDFLIQ
jgi:flagellar FliL protein